LPRHDIFGYAFVPYKIYCRIIFAYSSLKMGQFLTLLLFLNFMKLSRNRWWF